MDELLKQLELPDPNSPETVYIRKLKEILAVQPDASGSKNSKTFKLEVALDGAITKQMTRHGMTLTDLLTHHIRTILPVLQKATPMEVPGYKPDRRAAPKGRRHR